MKKRITLLTAGILCTASLAAGAIASGVVTKISAELRPDFTVEIDGKVHEFKNVGGEPVYPVLYNGTTYLPIRAIGNLMGKTVYWYEADKRIVLKDEPVKDKMPTVTDADVIVGDEKKPASKPEKETAPINKNFIGEQKAKEAALKKAGFTTQDIIFDKVELDKDNGIWQYEVEFKKGYVEYEVSVKADDGTILFFKKDIDD